MTNRGHALSCILFTSDSNLQAQLAKDLKKAKVPASMTVVKSLAAMQRVTAKRTVDVVIFETKRGAAKQLAEVQQAVDPSKTFVLAGSRAILRRAAGVVHSLAPSALPSVARMNHSSLEDYLDSKLYEFVKGMKNGSARNLHPMLIKAVERPLISHALKETNGNQIQTAHLLGMNRNTLRKKINELRIPIKRERTFKA